MTHKSPKIIFFGTEDYSLGTLQALVGAGFIVSAVITKPDAARGRGQKITESPVKTYALAHNIPVMTPAKLRDITEDIRALQPVAGILVAYGKIIPQSIIDLFEPGIINLHPSLLPRWRGPSPIEAAISHSDTETGVTIMKLEAAMDAGPIYVQKSIPLTGTETKPELYETLFSLGNSLLIDTLPAILSGKLTPNPQTGEPIFCSLLSKHDSLIDPKTMTAQQADAHIRAHLGFPRSRVNLGSDTCIITKAHTSKDADGPLSFPCRDGIYLTIDELISPKSGKKMTAEAFLRGH